MRRGPQQSGDTRHGARAERSEAGDGVGAREPGVAGAGGAGKTRMSVELARRSSRPRAGVLASPTQRMPVAWSRTGVSAAVLGRSGTALAKR